ncbi:MAG: uncharacterized protein QOD06_1038 [Candidatus Binatota bacterium]|nr:uncharacterized protein [Candidatus Binatota bacterium]
MRSGNTKVVHWVKTGDGLRVGYRGGLSGPRLTLHFGFDGWQEPLHDVALEPAGGGLALSDPIPVDDHLTLDCAITDGDRWDNNEGADYRLWIGFEPIDSHLHVSGGGHGDLGIRSLEIALASAGIGRGVVSWFDNESLDALNGRGSNLHRLVWLRPGETTTAEVRERLAAGAAGLKLHPTIDGYPADDRRLDRYVEIAVEVGCPVACHSAPGDADPDHIRRLAERFPSVPFVLYHTYLGPTEGRRRAARHVREQENLYLETSWCRREEVEHLIEEVGAARVLFGSDASVDGPHHYCRHPPNVEGKETYNDALVALVRALGPEAARKVMGDNARKVFRLNGSRVEARN